MSAFKGLNLIPVCAGTKIKMTGHTLEVREGTSVRSGLDLYLTPNDYDNLKRQIESDKPHEPRKK